MRWETSQQRRAQPPCPHELLWVRWCASWGLSLGTPCCMCPSPQQGRGAAAAPWGLLMARQGFKLGSFSNRGTDHPCTGPACECRCVPGGWGSGPPYALQLLRGQGVLSECSLEVLERSGRAGTCPLPRGHCGPYRCPSRSGPMCLSPHSPEGGRGTVPAPASTAFMLSHSRGAGSGCVKPPRLP